MKSTQYIQYFVEGECEKKLINALKTPPVNYLIAGKVDVFNVVIKRLSIPRIMSIKRDALVILVYDTDVKKDDILKDNIANLYKNGFKNIIHIQSVNSFEDELVFSCSIKSIHEIYNTQGSNEFKSMFIKSGNILGTLYSIGFDKNKIWTRIDESYPFNQYGLNRKKEILQKK